ncbi:uncharacterized protein BDZ83DRAFT_239485 [Colletotrichum acutatum]|uniref:Uncharacterized protein n=1 Tax=Glomerella acutata TaxID=27357 RepID=A0AAD8XHT5_GLOAC|nr:uncharacterized protein BDZ83DRAFT_239485 [Colletotrichum acutatum]KAK1726871.1 hypothetical protein BDZ83DRAFT_239485 [Colletotrichum acutatum]
MRLSNPRVSRNCHPLKQPPSRSFTVFCCRWLDNLFIIHDGSARPTEHPPMQTQSEGKGDRDRESDSCTSSSRACLLHPDNTPWLRRAALRCGAMLCDVFAMHQGFRQNVVDASSNKTATIQETRVQLIDSGICWCIRDTRGRNNAFRPVFVRDVSRLLNSVPIFAISAGIFQDLACSPLHVLQAKVQVQPKDDVISQCWLMRPPTN